MYLPLDKVFHKPTPQAEVYPPVIPTLEDEHYFQLLADYGIRLNPPQKAAVKAVDGPVLVISGAGSGKTTVLTSKIGYMIHSRNINPSNILLVTFTKKASIEMIERLNRIPGINRSASRSIVAGTYHSICLRILRAEGYHFKVLSSDKKKHYMIKIILKKMNRHEDYSPETIANLIASWKNSMIRPQDVEGETMVEQELKEVYSQYESLKEQENLFDFEDMLIETYYLLKYKPDVLNKYQQQFQYILCDEFQDTCTVQYHVVKLLAEPHRNLCIVGDDSQCIYGFRSASADFMINFDKVYPDCTKIVMDINYRSGPSIVGLGNAIIRHNQKQIEKTLKVSNAENHSVYFAQPRDSDEEANAIVEDIKEKYSAGIALRDMAVLYRTHATGRAIFDKLLLADIPFVTYGKSNESFYKNSFIRPMLALLRVSSNFADADAMVEAAPVLYISRNEMEKSIDMISVSHIGDTPKDLFKRVIMQIASQKPDFQKRQLLTKLECIRSLTKMTAPQAVREIRKGIIDYEKQLELDERKTLTVHKEMMLEILDECEQAARGFANPKEFLSFIERVEEKNDDMEELRNQPDIEAVRLMTIHASKGLEFYITYAIGWAEQILPHAASLDQKQKEDTNLSPEDSLEEERRLAYVCVTRAKKLLYISSPKTHRGNPAKVSRFIKEGLGLPLNQEEGEKAHV